MAKKNARGAARKSAEERATKKRVAKATEGAAVVVIETTPKEMPRWTRPDATGWAFVSFGISPKAAAALYARLGGEAVGPHVRKLVLADLGLPLDDAPERPPKAKAPATEPAQTT